MSTLKHRVTECLQELKLERPDIVIEESEGKVFATVTSETFKGMGNADRQRLVWNALRSCLSDEDVIAIEFVFTTAPNE